MRLTTVSGVAPPGYRYVPGLLAFRMDPAILDDWKILQNTPDLIIVHGHGIAHPRGLDIDLPHSIQFVMACCRSSSTPEPIRAAHKAAAGARAPPENVSKFA
jgi:deoxyinosine 3'endonuclease (endonuclease V)